jgi:hypothetical protein
MGDNSYKRLLIEGNWFSKPETHHGGEDQRPLGGGFPFLERVQFFNDGWANYFS